MGRKMDQDVVIIGAGAVGCACARELSKYNLKTAVLEKTADAASGTSGRNSAVVHAGFNNRTGSLMAEFCVEGSRRFGEICRQLDVPYQKTGKLLIAFNEKDMETLRGLVKQGRANGCSGLQMLDEMDLREAFPGISGIGGMVSRNTAITNPFLYTIALAENACRNGVQFYFRQEAVRAERKNGKIEIETADGSIFTTRYVVSCAGLFAADVSKLFGIDGYRIYPCRGQYLILDKSVGEICQVPVYPAPRKGIGGLGIHITPTVDGNVILGPSSEYISDKDDCGTTKEVLDKLFSEAQQILPSLKKQDIIGEYAGLRAKQAPPEEGGFRDFVIREEEAFPGFINLVGIESPGLTASVPIAEYVAGIIDRRERGESGNEKKGLIPKPDFVPERKGPVRFRELSEQEKKEIIRQNPNYGEIVCRCEKVTKQEVIDAIENPLHTVTLAGIKNRTRCMTGRCQGGYCLARIADILVHEYGYAPEEIVLREPDSQAFAGKVK